VAAAEPTHRWSGFYGGHAAQTPARAVGVRAGYNWQLDERWIYGIEGDVRSAGRARLPEGTGAFGGFTFGLGPSAGAGLEQGDAPWFGTLRVRGGFVTDEWLVYGTGGFAVGRAPVATMSPTIADAPGVSPAVTLPALSQGRTQFGWTVGGGVEKAFTPNLSAKLEYFYVDLGTQNSLAAADPNVKPRDHVVRFGLNYNFDYFDLRPFYRRD
jgi:outer membrane immunogenic protein